VPPNDPSSAIEDQLLQVVPAGVKNCGHETDGRDTTAIAAMLCDGPDGSAVLYQVFDVRDNLDAAYDDHLGAVGVDIGSGGDCAQGQDRDRYWLVDGAERGELFCGEGSNSFYHLYRTVWDSLVSIDTVNQDPAVLFSQFQDRVFWDPTQQFIPQTGLAGEEGRGA
jgi:hypothetical protein